MRTRLIAAFELALIFPAALFMTALLVRELPSMQFGLAGNAQQLVMWYAARMWTLWVLLLGLPFIVFVTGCATLRHSWNRNITFADAARQLLATSRANFATLLVAATTLVASVILVIVVLHMAAN